VDTVTCIVLVHAHPLECITSRTVHHASVIQMVKQTIQLFCKIYTEDVMVVQQLTRVADLSMCREEDDKRIEDW
jgi:hypothetical protein